jgi:hypothetical protein
MAGRSASLKAEIEAMAGLERIMSRLAEVAGAKAVDRVTGWYLDNYAAPSPDGQLADGHGPDGPGRAAAGKEPTP